MRLVVVLFLLLAGCAPPNYRVVVRNAVPVLIPPSVKNGEVARRSVRLPAGKCPAEVVDRDQWAQAPAGWLAARMADLQSRGCVEPGGGQALAERLTTSVPLPLGAAYRLMNPNPGAAGYLDLRPGYRLRVVSPILREGAAGRSAVAEGPSSVVSEKPGSLVVTAKASADLLGYETAWYSVGGAIAPLSAEARVGETVTQSAESRFRYFGFDPAARLFRMLFLTRSSESDRDALVVAARSESEMENATRELNAEPARCEGFGYRSRCVVLPRQVALTAFVVVTMNGEEALVAPGRLLGQALRDRSGWAAASLSVAKPFQGRLVEVAGPTEHLLALPLEGGERIDWGQRVMSKKAAAVR